MHDSKALKEYSILFTGLKLGLHEFKYDITKDFFTNFPHTTIDSGEVKIHLNFDKKETLFILGFQLKGIVNTECDRCLAPLKIFIDNNYKLFIKFAGSNEDLEEEPDMLFLPKDEVEINVAQLIFEYINLSLPSKKVHSKQTEPISCDKKVLSILSGYTPEEKQAEADARWNALKNIKIK